MDSKLKQLRRVENADGILERARRSDRGFVQLWLGALGTQF
jgi:hypothetical protein